MQNGECKQRHTPEFRAEIVKLGLSLEKAAERIAIQCKKANWRIWSVSPSVATYPFVRIHSAKQFAT